MDIFLLIAFLYHSFNPINSFLSFSFFFLSFQLKKALQLGLKLKEVHEGVSFQQSAFLKSFVEDCAYKRAMATNQFEKEFSQTQGSYGFNRGHTTI